MAAMQDVAHPRHLGMQQNRQLGKLCKMSDVEAGRMLDIPPSGVTAWPCAVISAVLVLPWSKLR
jgi:hypothetical protein